MFSRVELFCDLMYYSLTGSFVLGILQAYYNVSQKKDVKQNTFVATKMLSKGTATQSGLYC